MAGGWDSGRRLNAAVRGRRRGIFGVFGAVLDLLASSMVGKEASAERGGLKEG